MRFLAKPAVIPSGRTGIPMGSSSSLGTPDIVKEDYSDAAYGAACEVCTAQPPAVPPEVVHVSLLKVEK